MRERRTLVVGSLADSDASAAGEPSRSMLCRNARSEGTPTADGAFQAEGADGQKGDEGVVM